MRSKVDAEGYCNAIKLVSLALKLLTAAERLNGHWYIFINSSVHAWIQSDTLYLSTNFFKLKEIQNLTDKTFDYC